MNKIKEAKYYYAQIDENSVCIAVSQLHKQIERNNMIAIAESDNPAGKRWDGKLWVDLKLDPAPAPAPKNLTLLEFRNMFTMREKITLDNAALLLSDEHIQLKAALNTLMIDLSASSFIDPLHPDLIYGIALLHVNKILDSDSRAVDIICQLRRISIEEAQKLLAKTKV